MARAFPCGAILLLGAGCGFQKTEPISNVCGLLTVAEVQSLEPALMTATEQPPVDFPDLWTRICRFSAPGVDVHVDLGVSGALTPHGDQELADYVSGAPIPEIQVTPVSDLGDGAVYTNYRRESEALTAKQGGYLVGVSITGGSASSGELEPLVRSVLAKLP